MQLRWLNNHLSYQKTIIPRQWLPSRETQKESSMTKRKILKWGPCLCSPLKVWRKRPEPSVLWSISRSPLIERKANSPRCLTNRSTLWMRTFPAPKASLIRQQSRLSLSISPLYSSQWPLNMLRRTRPKQVERKGSRIMQILSIILSASTLEIKLIRVGNKLSGWWVLRKS